MGVLVRKRCDQPSVAQGSYQTKRRGALMKKKLPVALSIAALVVAVLGFTSFGTAAFQSSKQSVSPASKTTKVRRGPRGPRGPRGAQGVPGPAGPKGDK